MTEDKRDFQRFLNGVIERYPGGIKKLAADMGIENQSLYRARQTQGTLSPENCLKLADLTGEPPSRVLTLAGKGDVAALIELLYGKQTITNQERQLLDEWGLLDDDERQALRVLMAHRAWESNPETTP